MQCGRWDCLEYSDCACQKNHSPCLYEGATGTCICDLASFGRKKTALHTGWIKRVAHESSDLLTCEVGFFVASNNHLCIALYYTGSVRSKV